MSFSPGLPHHDVSSHLLRMRCVRPALGVLVLAVVCSFVLPAINAAIPNGERVRAGEVIDLGAGQLSFVPTPGWTLARGTAVGSTRSLASLSGTAEVVDGDVALTITRGQFSGTSQQLLGRVKRYDGAFSRIAHLRIASGRSTVVTDQGTAGTLQTYSGQHTDGLVATFVVKIPDQGSYGISVVARGSTGSLAADAPQIRSMIASIHVGSRGQS